MLSIVNNNTKWKIRRLKRVFVHVSNRTKYLIMYCGASALNVSTTDLLKVREEGGGQVVFWL